MDGKLLTATESDLFPSPIGELHFSIGKMIHKNFTLGFRPLSGSYISQYDMMEFNIFDILFPSPIGELHFSII